MVTTFFIRQYAPQQCAAVSESQRQTQQHLCITRTGERGNRTQDKNQKQHGARGADFIHRRIQTLKSLNKQLCFDKKHSY